MLTMLIAKFRQTLGVVLASMTLLVSTQNISAFDIIEMGTGLAPITDAQLLDFQENKPSVLSVKPNKIGVERIQKHRKDQGLAPIEITPASSEEEFVLVKGTNSVKKNTFQATSSTTLPSSVDNSQLPSFPPIGNQRGLGACVAWAVTYYQSTHEYGLLNGLNNKASSANILSPKWTYNLLNDGVDGGLYIVEAHSLTQFNGTALMSQFPYDKNYLAWDLNPQDWVGAISRRFQPLVSISGIGGTGSAQDLTTIKQTLVNGHVLNFGTCINSWVGAVVKADPSNPSSPHVGEQAVICQNGCSGTHCLTIVGYDDNVWIDINGNGVVDSGEKGAFLIANSWGPGYGNKGFIWIAYDAFLGTSAVVNGPNASNRTPLAGVSGSIVTSATPVAKSYSPKLFAQFSLSQSTRDQIAVVAGVSDVTGTVPTKTFASYALKNQGGNWEFDGTAPTTPETATFSLDLTDLLPAVDGTAQRYYLTVTDSTTGNPTTINTYSLIDVVGKNTVACANTPVSCDNAIATVYVDYTFTNNPTPPQAPTVAITAPTNNSNIYGSVWISAQAQDQVGIKNVDFYLDGTLLSSDVTAPYQVLLDTTTLKLGTHTISAIAYNTSGLSATSTVTVQVVAQPQPPTIAITSPANNSKVSGNITIVAHVKDQVGIKDVEFYIGETLLSTVSTAPYQAIFDTTKVKLGTYTLSAIAYSTSGLSSTASVNIQLVASPKAPTVTITSPNSSQRASGMLLVAATATDPVGIQSVAFYFDGVLNTTVTTAPYQFQLNTDPLPSGQHTIQAVATNNNGVTANDSVNFKIKPH